MSKSDIHVTPGAAAGRRRRPALSLGLALVFLASACGGGGGSLTTQPPPTTLTLSAVRAFPNLTFSSPVELLQAPGDNSRWFVVEQGGRVKRFDNQDATTVAPVVVLDIVSKVTSGSETGLLGMAFHPGFPSTNPRAYLYYTATVNGQLTSILSEFQTGDGGSTLDPASELVLLTVDQPEANHNGGHLAFGPDGFLYLGLGDGGGGGDVHGTIGNGQDPNTLLGKVIRIDVDHAVAPAHYAIPPTGNPNAGNALCSTGGGTAACPEIYALGVRNPWKYSFDRTGGALWIGDVGQDAYEEVDRITASANLGWRCREAAHAYDSNCGAGTGLTDPVAEYAHPLGEAITGGFVYRGSRFPGLRGRYVFGDFINHLLFNIDAATPSGSTLVVTKGDAIGTIMPSAFAEDQAGEIYIVDYSGALYSLNAM